VRHGPGRIADNRAPARNVAGNYGAGAHQRILTDRHAAEDRRAAPNAGAALHDGRDCLPIVVSLQTAVSGGCARKFIVDEDHSVADEYLIVNLDAFADKCVAGDFAAAADAGVLLNFDE